MSSFFQGREWPEDESCTSLSAASPGTEQHSWPVQEASHRVK